jgi:hypothetical protein
VPCGRSAITAATVTYLWWTNSTVKDIRLGCCKESLTDLRAGAAVDLLSSLAGSLLAFSTRWSSYPLRRG